MQQPTARGSAISTQIEKVWRFLWRHRRKFIVVGVISGALTFGWRFISSSLRSLQERQFHSLESQILRRARIHKYFEQAQETCQGYIRATLPQLHEKLDSTLPLPTPLELRGASISKQQKYALWNQLKIDAFARLLASIYGLCMISILVNIQVNLISRYVHLDKLSEEDDNEDESDMDDDNEDRLNRSTSGIVAEILSDDVQNKFFAAGKFVCEKGADLILEDMQRAASLNLKDVELSSTFDKAQLTSTLTEVVRTASMHSDRHLPARCLLPVSLDRTTTATRSRHNNNNNIGDDDDDDTQLSSDAVLALLLRETRARLESDAARTALRHAVHECVTTCSAALCELPGMNNGLKLAMLLPHVARTADAALHASLAQPLLARVTGAAPLRALAFAVLTRDAGAPPAPSR